MRPYGIFVFVALVCWLSLSIAGCKSNSPAPADNPRSARLCEDEMYRMGEQAKVMKKELEEAKASAAQAKTEKEQMEKGCGETASLMVDQIKDRDAQIESLNKKIAELEKGQHSAK